MADDAPSPFFTQERSEAIQLRVSRETREALDKWARKARTRVPTLVGALVNEWAHHAGGVWSGVWSKGSRVVLDWPLNGHFVILRVPREIRQMEDLEALDDQRRRIQEYNTLLEDYQRAGLSPQAAAEVRSANEKRLAEIQGKMTEIQKTIAAQKMAKKEA